MAEIRAWLSAHERQVFAELAAPPAPPKAKKQAAESGTALETLGLYRQGLSPDEIAVQRGLVASTIHSHLAQSIASGALEADPRDYYSAEDEQLLRQAVAEHGLGSLARLKEAVDHRLDYIALHYFRAFENRGGG
jgi:ATP-dependent DNA helicase RecQ